MSDDTEMFSGQKWKCNGWNKNFGWRMWFCCFTEVHVKCDKHPQHAWILPLQIAAHRQIEDSVTCKTQSWNTFNCWHGKMFTLKFYRAHGVTYSVYPVHNISVVVKTESYLLITMMTIWMPCESTLAKPVWNPELMSEFNRHRYSKS